MRTLTKLKRSCFTLFILSMALTLSGTGRSSTAQQAPAPSAAPKATVDQGRQNPNPDLTQQEVAKMDQFLDDHKDINKELEKNPSLVNDDKYLDHHKDLKTFFNENPRLHNEFVENPNYFMHRENRFEARESSQFQPDQNRQNPNSDLTRREAASFDQFLDSHPEIAEQVRKNPSLVDNREFVQNHPALQTYLENNPGVRDQLRQGPNAFLRQDRFDRADNGRDYDATQRDAAEFNRFLDGHREIAEQVRKNPSLVDNREFAQNHPALQAYLQNNPGVRDQIRQDPNAFMRQENRFDQTANGGDRDPSREHMASFGEFLGGHSNIAQDVSKNPSVVKNQEYVDNHRDLSEYLNAHPEVRNEWAANPQGFVKGAQQFSNGASTPGSTTTSGTNSGGGSSGNPNPAPPHDPKPKQ